MICWGPICIYFPYCIQVLLCHWDKQSGDMCFPKWCPHSSFLPRCSAWLHLIQEERSLAWAHWAYKVKKAIQMKQRFPGEMATEHKITASFYQHRGCVLSSSFPEKTQSTNDPFIKISRYNSALNTYAQQQPPSPLIGNELWALISSDINAKLNYE